jgi:hypothetical protein
VEDANRIRKEEVRSAWFKKSVKKMNMNRVEMKESVTGGEHFKMRIGRINLLTERNSSMDENL